MEINGGEDLKKKILSVAIVLSTVLYLAGCGKTYQEATGHTESESGEDFAKGYFTVVSKWGDSISTYYIVYAKDTKVKYFIKWHSSQWGITPLYNADGTLQIYEESED